MESEKETNESTKIIFNILDGMETTSDNITYKICSKITRLIVTHGSKGDSHEFLATGFLSRDLKQNFRFYLTKNGTYDSWNGAGVLLIRKGKGGKGKGFLKGKGF